MWTPHLSAPLTHPDPTNDTRGSMFLILFTLCSAGSKEAQDLDTKGSGEEHWSHPGTQWISGTVSLLQEGEREAAPLAFILIRNCVCVHLSWHYLWIKCYKTISPTLKFWEPTLVILKWIMLPQYFHITTKSRSWKSRGPRYPYLSLLNLYILYPVYLFC